jgi:hypothetical protein
MIGPAGGAPQIWLNVRGNAGDVMTLMGRFGLPGRKIPPGQ